jgi:hypothetical protein
MVPMDETFRSGFRNDLRFENLDGGLRSQGTMCCIGLVRNCMAERWSDSEEDRIDTQKPLTPVKECSNLNGSF